MKNVVGLKWSLQQRNRIIGDAWEMSFPYNRRSQAAAGAASDDSGSGDDDVEQADLCRGKGSVRSKDERGSAFLVLFYATILGYSLDVMLNQLARHSAIYNYRADGGSMV